MSRWWEIGGAAKGDVYDDRWRRMEARGEWVHGEADLVCWFEPGSVLDAGCGTGRVAVELDRRGIDVVGVDLDERMLEEARAKAPHVQWVLGDLVDVEIAGPDSGTRAGTAEMRENVEIAGPDSEAGAGTATMREDVEIAGPDSGAGAGTAAMRAFDLIVMAGNVMVFVEVGTEAAIVANMAGHLAPGGRLVTGFRLGLTPLTFFDYDRFAADAGLALEHRWTTWDRQPYDGGSYAVTVHRLPANA